ncbi:phage tail protein [Vibrio kyushuensis]|uniref:phage tail protein n=1 Tax=Vibrio TaxID=662 RepID=UPI003D0EDAE3
MSQQDEITQYEEGYKLRDLTEFLKARLGERISKRLTAEMTNVQLILTPKNMGNQCMQLMIQRYTAELYIERLPFQQYSPAILFANVAAWLMDNDQDRDEQLSDLGDPETDVNISDSDSAEVLIEIVFEEPVKVIEDPQGPIHWRGKQYRIEEYDIWTATKLRDVVILKDKVIGHAPS